MTDEFLDLSLVKYSFEVILISAERAIERAYSIGGFCEESYRGILYPCGIGEMKICYILSIQEGL